MADNNTPKRRAVVSYEKLSQELIDAFREKYPRGYSDYLNDIILVKKSDDDYFYTVPLETEEVSYLVKVKVKEDHIEDLEDDLFQNDGQDDDDSDESRSDGDFPVSEDDMSGAPDGIVEGDDEGGDE